MTVEHQTGTAGWLGEREPRGKASGHPLSRSTGETTQRPFSSQPASRMAHFRHQRSSGRRHTDIKYVFLSEGCAAESQARSRINNYLTTEEGNHGFHLFDDLCQLGQ